MHLHLTWFHCSLETELGSSQPTLLGGFWNQGGSYQEQQKNNSRNAPPKREVQMSEEQLKQEPKTSERELKHGQATKETEQKQGKRTNTTDLIQQQTTKDAGLKQRQETHEKELKQREQNATGTLQEQKQEKVKDDRDIRSDDNKLVVAPPPKVVASLPLCPVPPPKLGK